ncbi:hypothetical protein RB195_018677 [Necator americanus]|uniref:Uncharacterized protein n=1 Tax=Necator americanus TaxID=51031 RepID=A0ABR1CAV0_NECAM
MTVDQCPANIILAPCGHPLIDRSKLRRQCCYIRGKQYESSTCCQSKLAAAYGLRLRPDKCKQMWISSRPQAGIRVDGPTIELVDEFCFLTCMLKNVSHEKDIQHKRTKATCAIRSMKCLWWTPSPAKWSLSAIRPIMMCGSETSPALATVMESFDCRERELFTRLLGYFCSKVCEDEDVYVEIDVVYRDDTWKVSTSCSTIESSYRKSSPFLCSHTGEDCRSPCSTSSEQFVGFKQQKVTCPKMENEGGKRRLEDTRRT